MRAKLVNESINFERGGDPLERMDIGQTNLYPWERENLGGLATRDFLSYEDAIKLLKNPELKKFVIKGLRNQPKWTIEYQIHALNKLESKGTMYLSDLMPIRPIYHPAMRRIFRKMEELGLVDIQREKGGRKLLISIKARTVNEEIIINDKGGKEWIDPFKHIPINKRNWYQKPENQEEYIRFQQEKKKEEKRIKSKKIRNLPKVKEKMDRLEEEIYDLEQELKDMRKRNKDLNSEMELFSGWIIDNYDWNVLEILNSGVSDEEKIKGLKSWNLNQDQKNKEIKDPQKILKEYNDIYSDNNDEEEEIIEKISELKELYSELDSEIS